MDLFRNTLWTVLCLSVLLSCNSVHPPQKEVKKKQMQGKQVSENKLKIAFSYPVLQVNERRARFADAFSDELLTLTFPEQSHHNLTLSFADTFGNERLVKGKLHVHSYTKRGLEDAGEVVVIPRTSLEEAYRNLLRNGYSHLVIREVDYSDVSGQPGKILVDLELGARAIQSKDVEIRFGDGAIYEVQAQRTPVSLTFPENSIELPIYLTLEEGYLELEGTIKVYNSNEFTDFAPIWVDFDQQAQERILKSSDKIEIALYVPARRTDFDNDFITFVEPEENPAQMARRLGTMVAVMKLRKVQQPTR